MKNSIENLYDKIPKESTPKALDDFILNQAKNSSLQPKTNKIKYFKKRQWMYSFSTAAVFVLGLGIIINLQNYNELGTSSFSTEELFQEQEQEQEQEQYQKRSKDNNHKSGKNPSHRKVKKTTQAHATLKSDLSESEGASQQRSLEISKLKEINPQGSSATQHKLIGDHDLPNTLKRTIKNLETDGVNTENLKKDSSQEQPTSSNSNQHSPIDSNEGYSGIMHSQVDILADQIIEPATAPMAELISDSHNNRINDSDQVIEQKNDSILDNLKKESASDTLVSNNNTYNKENNVSEQVLVKESNDDENNESIENDFDSLDRIVVTGSRLKSDNDTLEKAKDKLMRLMRQKKYKQAKVLIAKLSLDFPEENFEPYKTIINEQK